MLNLDGKPYKNKSGEDDPLVSVREHVESVESPVILLWQSDSQEAADVDASEPPPLRP
jgi:hypothetical protein